MDEENIAVFAALAEPSRMRMVSLLRSGPLSVGEIAERLQIRQPQASKHLKVLQEAGLVTKTRRAQMRPVHLEAQVFDLMTAWIERYRRQAEERYSRLDAVLADLNEAQDGLAS